jgi:bifunctional DNA-binding transcriptional regulator/antitoxin component of YhaV-PrlF toxin-antitoxin module
MKFSFVMTTTLTGKNQITIPAALASRYGLKPGTKIEWRPGEAPDEIRCRVLPKPAEAAAALRGAGRKFLRSGDTHPIEGLLNERSKDDALRTQEL